MFAYLQREGSLELTFMDKNRIKLDRMRFIYYRLLVFVLGYSTNTWCTKTMIFAKEKYPPADTNNKETDNFESMYQRLFLFTFL